MAVDIRNYIKSKISEYDSNLDVRDGSVLNDIVIAPLQLILQNYETTQQSILDSLSLTDIANMSEDALDNIAKTFLLERQTGAKATGTILIYLNNPKSVNIPAGTVFSTSDGFSCEAVQDYYLSQLAMSGNMDYYPYYVAGPIKVVALTEGTDSNLNKDTVFQTPLKLAITPAKILANTDFIGGLDKETNTQLYERIVNSLAGATLSSPSSIRATIQAVDPNIGTIEIVGAGSEFMLRDLITDSTYWSNNYTDLNFRYAASGVHNVALEDNPNIAYEGIFMDLDPNDAISLPTIANFTDEFTNSMYKGLYTPTSPLWAETTQHILIDDFNIKAGWNEDIGYMVTDGSWRVNDSSTIDSKVETVNEIYPTQTGVRLGWTAKDTDTDQTIKLSKNKLDTLIADATTGLDSNDPTYASTLISTIKDASSVTNQHNYSPVLHKAMSQHAGIAVLCSMSTTDNTDTGEMAYITVLRNSTQTAPQDGYGLAWRKQPEFLLRMQANSYTDVNLKNSDLAQFLNEYNTIGTAYLGHIKDYPEFWKYNVFLVDNDILQEETWVGNDQIWDQTGGANQFLQAGKVWIEPNKIYDFKYIINESLSFDAWIVETGQTMNDTNKVLSRGVYSPQYLPASGDKDINPITGKLTLSPEKNHFGIGVGETKNCEWYVSQLKVWSIVESFPMHLFKFQIDTSKFIEDEEFNIEYYGFACDEDMALDTSITSAKYSKVNLAIYNVSTGEWNNIGTNTYDPRNYLTNVSSLQMSDIKINPNSNTIGAISNYIDSNTNYLYLMAYAANIGSGFTDSNHPAYNTNHTLRSYYVKLDNKMSTMAHRGNCTDIYCSEPTKIKEGSVVVQVVGNSFETKFLAGIDGYIQEILGVRDYLSQIDLNTDEYVITNLDEGNTYSVNANYKVTLTDATDEMLVEVYYRYWDNGDVIESEIITSDSRYPNADYTVKTFPPVVVNITKLNYSGGLTEAEMKTVIKNYINTTDEDSLDKSDLISLLYQNGATFVDLDIDIILREYDLVMHKNTIVLGTANSYTLPADGLRKFYTTESELIGVTKLG